MNCNIDLLHDEYLSLDPIRNRDEGEEIDWSDLANALITDCEWTPHAAETLTTLVRRYGGFVLRNAHALAVACDVEDGEFGI